MRTNSRKNKLLSVLAGVALSVVTLMLMGPVRAMAAGNEDVICLNVGAAEVLEGFEEIAVEASQQDQKADSKDEMPKSGLVMADVKNSLNARCRSFENLYHKFLKCGRRTK